MQSYARKAQDVGWKLNVAIKGNLRNSSKLSAALMRSILSTVPRLFSAARSQFFREVLRRSSIKKKRQRTTK